MRPQPLTTLSLRTPRIAPLVAAVLSALVMAGCTSWPLAAGDEAPPADQGTMADGGDQAASAGYNRADQAPGFFRMRMGKYVITALYDGSIDINSTLMKGRPQATITRMLSQAKQPRDVRTPVNAFLLDDGERIVLVDAGASEAFGESMGKLQASLTMSGYKPEDIQIVLLTHLHPDHVGGLLLNNQAAFPNAQVYAPQSEAAHWLSEERNNSASQQVFKGVQGALAAYQASGRFHTFAAGAAPVEGIDSMALPGHTPGHTAYKIQSGKETMLIWGDVVHSASTQFSDPTISLEFDNDQKKARVSRAKALREAAVTGEWVAGAHLPFPGIGRVQTLSKTSYRWLPIDYSQAMTDPEQRQPSIGSK